LLATPRAHAATANPAPPPDGAIQVGFRGEPVRNIRVRSGNQKDAVWLANQFNGMLWAYTYAGEMLVVPPNGTFVMADFPPSGAPLPWVGIMGPRSPFPGAAIAVLQVQSGYLQVALEVEIRGGNTDVVFDQVLEVIYSYDPGA
jgi:hypothetical protein